MPWGECGVQGCGQEYREASGLLFPEPDTPKCLLTFLSILQIKKLRLREVETRAQGHPQPVRINVLKAQTLPLSSIPQPSGVPATSLRSGGH